jgi:hypothetical protein
MHSSTLRFCFSCPGSAIIPAAVFRKYNQERPRFIKLKLPVAPAQSPMSWQFKGSNVNYFLHQKYIDTGHFGIYYAANGQAGLTSIRLELPVCG